MMLILSWQEKGVNQLDRVNHFTPDVRVGFGAISPPSLVIR